jgi:hypothetical protein
VQQPLAGAAETPASDLALFADTAAGRGRRELLGREVNERGGSTHRRDLCWWAALAWKFLGTLIVYLCAQLDAMLKGAWDGDSRF